MKLNICHLYPDLLNLYGDQGNIICMKKRLEWRRIDVTVTLCGAGDPLNAGDYDLFFINGQKYSLFDAKKYIRSYFINNKQ